MFLQKNGTNVSVVFIIGLFLGSIITVIYKNHKIIGKLDNVVLLISFMIAVLCLAVCFIGKETEASIQVLGFYTSFIFSWLLTKKSSVDEYKKTQHKVARNTFRHIRDVETAVLYTRERLYTLKEKTEITEEDINGIIDNVAFILAGIRSSEDDWKDMLKKSYRQKIEDEIDPETDILNNIELQEKRHRNNQSSILQHPTMEQLHSINENAKESESK